MPALSFGFWTFTVLNNLNLHLHTINMFLFIIYDINYYLCLPILQKTVEDISERNESLECPVIDIVDNSDCQDVVETCSSQTQTEPCNSAVSTTDKDTQVEQFPMRPYHLYESRKRSDIRTEIINQIRHLLSGYVHGDEDSLATIAQDLIHSKKWATIFGVPEVKQDKCMQDKVLQSIVKEYKECKSKETNSLIRSKGRKLKQAINISGTMSSSSIAFQGTTPDCFKSRTEAARSMGRVVCYSAERRRLLSIVAAEYPQTYLTELFQCSKSTVTAARVHSILFGRGGFPLASLKFSSVFPRKSWIIWLIFSYEMMFPVHHLVEVSWLEEKNVP